METEVLTNESAELPGKAPTTAESLEAAYDATVGKAEPAQGAIKAKQTDAERARDEAGRFARKEGEEKPKPATAVSQTEVAKPEKFGIKRPDSWKKELWSIWDKLDAGETLTREEQKQFLQYIPERESQYQSGVSTYKAEWDRAKPLIEAMSPYQPMLQQAGIQPEQAVAALMQNHQALAYGTPQQKLETFARLSQEYGVPLNELLIQGEDGKVYINQQYFKAQQQAKQPNAVTPQDVDRIVAQRMQQVQVQAAVSQFQSAKDKDGQPLYPHFETVKQTMDGLLRSGLATDLHGAYESALALPQHRALYEAQQTAKREAEDAAKRAEAAAKAERARHNTISTKTSSPTGQPKTKGNGREAIVNAMSDAYDAHVGGRI